MTRNTYKFCGPNTWALAREAYLAGETAESVAQRFDLTVSCMRRRMRLEGLSRRDHVAALDALAPRRDAAETTAPELLRRALCQAAEALEDGCTADARTLSQMAESLSRTAARDPKTSLETILRVLRDTAFCTELFRIDPDATDDPDLPVKRADWGLEGGGG